MKKKVAALGFFDGVHLGHAALLKRTAELAALTETEPVVITFDRAPRAALDNVNIPLINTPEERQYLVRQYYGIEAVIFLKFDEALRSTAWKDFYDDILVRDVGCAAIVAGWNYRFGRGGEGTAEKLREYSLQRGILCNILDRVTIDGETVSSSYIRSLIAGGELDRAAEFLGHPHIISGTVVQGKMLGRRIGMPTVNLRLSQGLQSPRFGVYASRVRLDGRTYIGVTNIGVNPTVSSDSDIKVETHIIGFDGDLYGRHITLEMGSFIREERRFDSVEVLKEQIERDRSRALELMLQRQ